MKAIQSVVYALFRVNIFANASAKSYSAMAGSAKKAKKETEQLAGIHDEINNIQSNDNSDSGSGAGGASPNFDLSSLDSQMSPFAQKLYDFFKPLKDSWDIYGSMVIEAFKNAFNGMGSAVSAMWSSVESIFTNGTIYSIIANILNSIGEIGKAWANAWTNGNNGTEIVQGIANVIDDLTGAILNLVSSTGFQSFLNGIVSTFSGIVQFLGPIISGFIEMSEAIMEIVMSAIGDLLTLIGDALQAIAQNEIAATVLKAVGGAIAIIVAAILAWNVAQLVLNGLIGLFTLLTSPITLIILGIVAAITAIIWIIQNWGTVLEWLGNIWNAIVDFVVGIVTGWIEFQKAKFEFLKNIISTIFTAIKDFFVNVWNAIVSTVSTIIENIKNTIQNVLNTIKTIWDNIWNGLKTTVTNIFNGIWNTIKSIINSILGGIEGMANGIVKGINAVINTLNKLKFNIPDWIPGLGGKQFGFSIGLIPQVSLPRLAKGGVLTEETAVIAGEYSGAKSNPEIVTPQNIMYDTMRRALSDSDITNNDDKPIYLTVNVGNTKLGQILLDDLRNMKRRTGNSLEALVGG